MPLLSTVACAAVIERLGDAAQRASLLGPVAAGASVLAFAHEEGRHHAPTRIATSLRARGDDLVLRGEKSFVPDGHGASAYVVVARSDGESDAPGGLSVVVVPASAPGLVATRLHVVDGRNVARVRFDDVVVPRAGVLGPLGGAAEALERARDRAAVALSAEMLGGALEAFERTVAYLKERRRFGVPIGSFQALGATPRVRARAASGRSSWRRRAPWTRGARTLLASRRSRRRARRTSSCTSPTRRSRCTAASA